LPANESSLGSTAADCLRMALLVLRQIERRLSVADRLAACIDDPRDPGSTVHTLADIIASACR
jgi:hypothetical protein